MTLALCSDARAAAEAPSVVAVLDDFDIFDADTFEIISSTPTVPDGFRHFILNSTADGFVFTGGLAKYHDPDPRAARPGTLGIGWGESGPLLALNARADRLYAVVRDAAGTTVQVFDLRRSDRAEFAAEVRVPSGYFVATNVQTGRVYVFGGSGPTIVISDPVARRRSWATFEVEHADED